MCFSSAFNSGYICDKGSGDISTVGSVQKAVQLPHGRQHEKNHSISQVSIFIYFSFTLLEI